MRAIVIDPKTRSIYELPFVMAPDFMDVVAHFVGADTLALDAAPPHTAMFLDAIGFLRGSSQAFWRKANATDRQNVAGVGVMFGLAPDGKLADLPAAITVEGLRSEIVWVDDVIAKTIQRMAIVDMPGGKAPIVQREVVWQAGAVTPAAEVTTPVQRREVIETAGDADVYAQGSPPAPAAASPAATAAAKGAEAAPAASLAPIWAIHETPDNRYRVIEYEITPSGALGSPLSLATVPNIDEARARVPKGLMMRAADDDVEDDTLVETWS